MRKVDQIDKVIGHDIEKNKEFILEDSKNDCKKTREILRNNVVTNILELSKFTQYPITSDEIIETFKNVTKGKRKLKSEEELTKEVFNLIVSNNVKKLEKAPAKVEQEISKDEFPHYKIEAR